MAKSADARDLKSLGLILRTGSSPVTRTITFILVKNPINTKNTVFMGFFFVLHSLKINLKILYN